MPFLRSGNRLRFEHEGRYYTVGGFKESVSEQEADNYVDSLNQSEEDRHDEMLEWEVNGTYTFY